MSNVGLPMWLRVVIGIAAGLFIWWRISKRWDRASAYSDAMAEEIKEQKAWYEKTKVDERVLQFKKELAARYSIADGKEAGGENYIIRYMAFYNKGQICPPGDWEADFISFFLQGKNKIIVSKNLVTGEIVESSRSAMSFNLTLPEWLKRGW